MRLTVLANDASDRLVFSLLWFNAQQWQLRLSRSQLKAKRTCGFGIRAKIRCGLRFFGVFLCGFAVFRPPLRPPQYWRSYWITIICHHRDLWHFIIYKQKRMIIPSSNQWGTFNNLVPRVSLSHQEEQSSERGSPLRLEGTGNTAVSTKVIPYKRKSVRYNADWCYG